MKRACFFGHGLGAFGYIPGHSVQALSSVGVIAFGQMVFGDISDGTFLADLANATIIILNPPRYDVNLACHCPLETCDGWSKLASVCERRNPGDVLSSASDSLDTNEGVTVRPAPSNY